MPPPPQVTILDDKCQELGPGQVRRPSANPSPSSSFQQFLQSFSFLLCPATLSAPSSTDFPCHASNRTPQGGMHTWVQPRSFGAASCSRSMAGTPFNTRPANVLPASHALPLARAPRRVSSAQILCIWEPCLRGWLGCPQIPRNLQIPLCRPGIWGKASPSAMSSQMYRVWVLGLRLNAGASGARGRPAVAAGGGQQLQQAGRPAVKQAGGPAVKAGGSHLRLWMRSCALCTLSSQHMRSPRGSLPTLHACTPIE